jgi:5'-nucleotidase
MRPSLAEPWGTVCDIAAGTERRIELAMGETPRILVSNDDGYMSAGIQALVEAMEGLGEVWVVAPLSEQSASSHAISIHRPIRLHEVRTRWYAVDGTPTDCSWIGINHILRDHRPHLVVSGINHGPNLADDVTYSGTVAAAMEASILGVPAIAFSLATRQGFTFGPAARFARALVTAALSTPDLVPGMLLNVNVPGGEPDGYSVTRLGKHSYGSEVVEKVDPRGRKYYWIGGNEYQHEDIPGSDCNVVLRQRRISVTPLQLDLTDDDMLSRVAGWPVDGFARQGS